MLHASASGRDAHAFVTLARLQTWVDGAKKMWKFEGVGLCCESEGTSAGRLKIGRSGTASEFSSGWPQANSGGAPSAGWHCRGSQAEAPPPGNASGESQSGRRCWRRRRRWSAQALPFSGAAPAARWAAVAESVQRSYRSDRQTRSGHWIQNMFWD